MKFPFVTFKFKNSQGFKTSCSVNFGSYQEMFSSNTYASMDDDNEIDDKSDNENSPFLFLNNNKGDNSDWYFDTKDMKYLSLFRKRLLQEKQKLSQTNKKDALSEYCKFLSLVKEAIFSYINILFPRTVSSVTNLEHKQEILRQLTVLLAILNICNLEFDTNLIKEQSKKSQELLTLTHKENEYNKTLEKLKKMQWTYAGVGTIIANGTYWMAYSLSRYVDVWGEAKLEENTSNPKATEKNAKNVVTTSENILWTGIALFSLAFIFLAIFGCCRYCRLKGHDEYGQTEDQLKRTKEQTLQTKKRLKILESMKQMTEKFDKHFSAMNELLKDEKNKENYTVTVSLNDKLSMQFGVDAYNAKKFESVTEMIKQGFQFPTQNKKNTNETLINIVKN